MDSLANESLGSYPLANGRMFEKKRLIVRKNIKGISRSGAVVARWAHNPKVVGSSPASATNKIKGFQSFLKTRNF